VELFGAPHSAPHRTGQMELFGAPPVWFRGSGNPLLFGASGPPAQPGTRQPEFFGTPRVASHRGLATGTLRRAARRVSRGMATGALRSSARCASPGSGRRHSSEGRAPSLTGARVGTLRRAACWFHLGQESPRLTGIGPSELFGAPSVRLIGMGPRPPWGRAPNLFGGSRPASRHPATGTLRRVVRQVPPGPPALRSELLTGSGNRSSSEPCAPSLTGVRQTALFGGPRAEPHRDQGSGALRSVASRFHRDRVTVPLRRNGNRVSPGAGSSGLTGVRHTALFGGSRAEPHRVVATGTLRSAGRCSPPGKGSQSSSEPRRSFSFETGHSSHRETGLSRPSGRGKVGDPRVRVNTSVRPPTSVGVRSARTPAHVGAYAGQDSNDRMARAAVMRYGC
jgi:hypothetical protein